MDQGVPFQKWTLGHLSHFDKDRKALYEKAVIARRGKTHVYLYYYSNVCDKFMLLLL